MKNDITVDGTLTDFEKYKLIIRLLFGVKIMKKAIFFILGGHLLFFIGGCLVEMIRPAGAYTGNVFPWQGFIFPGAILFIVFILPVIQIKFKIVKFPPTHFVIDTEGSTIIIPGKEKKIPWTEFIIG